MGPSVPVEADPQRILESVFGYREFRPGQRHIIDAVLAGRDCIGVMPTGAGKSLTFQIPARILPGTVLVISPLISLMKDQVDELERLGYRAAVINSTVESEVRRQRLDQLRRGELELVYVAPEGKPSGLRMSSWRMISPTTRRVAVAVSARTGMSPSPCLRPRSRRYEGLKSCPQWLMQCASSTTTRLTQHPAMKARSGPSIPSGAT